jgi:hypothetical protein
VAILRVTLGLIFASAALSYFWERLFGWPLLPLRVTPEGLRLLQGIIEAGYLWPLMKSVNLVAGLMLIVNRAPALALALLAPVTVIIIWFQLLFNPLPLPLVTVVIVVACELLLLRAYAGCYAGLFRKDSVSS